MSSLKKIGKPELFPAYVFIAPPDEASERLRGRLFFDQMAEMGLRVTQVKGVEPGDEVGDGVASVPIVRPWTFLFMSVPSVDFTDYFGEFAMMPCSIIMDVHFPIMDREKITVTGRGSVEQVWADRDVMLANLAGADAVTVSHPDWAADLAEINPNVFYLPDIAVPDEAYTAIAGAEDAADMDQDLYQLVFGQLCEFTLRFAEVAQSSMRRKEQAVRDRS